MCDKGNLKISKVYDRNGKEIKIGDVICSDKGNLLVVSHHHGALGCEISKEYGYDEGTLHSWFYPFCDFVGFRFDYHHKNYDNLVGWIIIGKL